MVTSWTSPLRHPYLDMPSLKRKHSYDGSPTSSSDELPPAFPAFPSSPVTPVDVVNSLDHFDHNPSKRRRCETLERDFRELSLEKPEPRPLGIWLEHQPVDRPFGYTPMTDEDETIIDLTTTPPPVVVSAPPAPEVKMHTQTWYEPEKDRIVVVSLDDSDSEPSSPTLKPQDSSFLSPTASPNDKLVTEAMLMAMREPTSSSPKTLPPLPLILFDPDRRGDLTKLQRLTTETGRTDEMDIVLDRDAMEVEDF